jgi:hypothetical protein
MMLAAGQPGNSAQASFPGLAVDVAYADNDPGHSGGTFPSPWKGSPNVIFEGCTPGCTFDSGAILIQNLSSNTMTIAHVTASIGASCTFDIWPSNMSLPAGKALILAQESTGSDEGCPSTSDGTFDTSDVINYPECNHDRTVPIVRITIGTATASYLDTGQVLNTGGIDPGYCSGSNESEQWVPIGPPAAPTNLAATSLDSTSILLTWTDNSGNESGFEINNGVTSQKVTANNTSYTWGGLAPNTYMCFRIRAYNSTGSSSWDPNVSPYYVCTTTPDAGLPAAPSTLAATPVNSDSIRLTWADNSGNESGFEINNGVTSQYAAANSTGYTWPDLAAGTYMCFRIRAYNSTGSSSWAPKASPYYVCTTTPKTAACPAAVVVGVHGVGEGPSSKISAVSTTLQDTYGGFTVAANKQGQPKESFDPINYPTVPVSKFGTKISLTDLLNTVQKVAAGLNTSLTGLTSACPHMSISLAGYSLGAWIINYMLIGNQQLWPHIASVAYYGDPCYSSGQYAGLAQRFVGGCGPKSTYPYPSSQANFPVHSWCLNKDPICGLGYASSIAGGTQQLYAAYHCTTSNGCTHFDYVLGYPNSGPTVSGGQFLESHALG